MFYIWYVCLAPVHKLLAWEVGLDSLSTFHGLAMYCLCLEFGNVGNRGLVLLGRVWGLLSIECFIVTQMNCSISLSFTTSPVSQYCQCRTPASPALEG